MDTQAMIDSAKAGNGAAVDALVRSVRDRIWAFSLKMLYNPPDAEDATQEILIKIITRLGSFRRESAFETWAMKIAANHLLNRLRDLSRRRLTFQFCEDMILREVPDPSTLSGPRAEQDLVVHEMRVFCVLGLFRCLDRNLRVAYILGATMDITGPVGAEILGITPETFRKRLSRARRQVREFLTLHCELFNPDNPCKCRVQAADALEKGLLPLAGTGRVRRQEAALKLTELERLTRETALMRLAAEPPADPDRFVRKIRALLDSGKFELNG